jgi:hypothetical protein
MTRTGLAMPDEPDEPDDWAKGQRRMHADLLRHVLVVKHHAVGSHAKATILRRIESVDFDIVFPYRFGGAKATGDDLALPFGSDWAKALDLDVVATTNYDRILERAVLDRHLVAEVKTVAPAVPSSPPWYARISPRKLTWIAVFIAGHQRAALGEEWRAHLSEKGACLTKDQQAMEAAGFVRAAVTCRVEDTVDWLWESVDAVLGSRWMSSLFVLLAVVGISVVFIRQGGLYVLADNIGGVGVVFGAALGVIHVGRKVRGVKPPKLKPPKKRQ